LIPVKLMITRISLPPEETPRYWHNILPDLPEPLPDPVPELGGEPSRKKVLEMLAGIFTKTGLRQEYSDEPRIRIPEGLWEMFIHVGRPTPLHRAKRLEEHLKTPARIYFKREDTLPTGSFKLNTVLAQLYFAKEEGFTRVVDGTGAGQTGSAVAWAAASLGLRAKIFMVRSSYKQKPLRVTYMKMCGADVTPSPSNETELGRPLFEKDPEDPGSLGIVSCETNEWAAQRREDTVTVQGSIFNFVMTQQTIIGLETKKQLELVEEEPDVMFGCVGAGSNFLGFTLPYISERIKGRSRCRFVAVEPSGVAPEVNGEYRYDLLAPGTTGPLYKMYTLGCDYKIPLLVAEGLRYQGTSPLLSFLRNRGLVDAVAVDESAALNAGKICLMKEGFLPAPEPAYAIKAAVDEALRARDEGREEVIVANISGVGFLDLEGYGRALTPI
jgi:tryptophan synthase beta chain